MAPIIMNDVVADHDIVAAELGAARLLDRLSNNCAMQF
jgi:hypothetical protein